jgi:hypothetical protein
LNLSGQDDKDACTEDELSEAFAAFGLVPEGKIQIEDDFYLWPENLPAFNFWLAVQSQWVWHEGHRMGLNYAGVEVRLKYWSEKKAQRRALLESTCALEGECMRAWSEARK